MARDDEKLVIHGRRVQVPNLAPGHHLIVLYQLRIQFSKSTSRRRLVAWEGLEMAFSAS
jgi:hypothetical protein